MFMGFKEIRLELFFMVDRSSELRQLNQITDVLNNLVETVQDPTKPLNRQEFDNLVTIIKNYNSVIAQSNPKFLQGKSLTQGESIDESINQAIKAVQAFQGIMQHNPQRVGRNVREMIGIIYSQTERDKELNKFKSSVDNLKEKWKRLRLKLESSEQTNLGKGNG